MTTPIPPLDLLWLLFETPSGPTHVGAMLLFKKPPGRTPVVREIVDAYRGYQPAPPFNFVPELLGGGGPRFREVASWDSRHHIRHLALPVGSSYDDLLRLVADLHEPMLDRDRPLFRCWVIDGVPGGMFAIYMKVHHAVVDGVSALKSVYAGLSTSDGGPIAPPGFARGTPAHAPHSPGSAAQRIAHSIGAAVKEVGALNQVSLGVLRKTVAGLTGSCLEGSVPFTAQRAPTNQPVTMGRGFATLSLPLEQMHDIGRHFGATLNDVAVTVIDAGLHAYLQETGRAFAHPFVASCPISLRARGDTTVGTRASAMFVRLGEPGAAMPERIRQVVESIAAAKTELGAMSDDAAMTYGTGLLALAGLATLVRLDRVGRPACNLVISNVPGAKEPRYLNGARLVGIYPVSAIGDSVGLNVTLASHHNRMDFGFVASANTIDDLPRLAHHALGAYRELREAAGRRPTNQSRASSRTTG